MPINLADNEIQTAKIGTQEVVKIYVGSTLVWENEEGTPPVTVGVPTGGGVELIDA